MHAGRRTRKNKTRMFFLVISRGPGTELGACEIVEVVMFV